MPRHSPFPSLPVPDVPQRECARGLRCEGRWRDAGGGWHPARCNSPLCPRCEVRVAECAALIPRLFALAAAGVAVRGGRGVRSAPGPRVPVSAAADAYGRECAAVTGGWAARVRRVPGLSLSPSRHRHGTAQRVRDDCAVLAAHRVQLLALPAGETVRAYRWPLSPAEEERLAGCDILRVGEDWVRVLEPLDGAAAGLEIIGLHARGERLAGFAPAPPELLDGIPCRGCEAMPALAVIPQPPPDPAAPEPAWCRCTACGDEMTRGEYEQWTAQYAAWVRGAGAVTCARCERGGCGDCCLPGCACTAPGHGMRR